MRILLLIGFIAIMGVTPIYGNTSLFQVLVLKYLYIAWVGFLMLNFIFNPQPLFAFNKKGVFHYLGKISFGIYMYNNILLAFITDNVLARNGNVVTMIGYFLIYIAGTILIAVISWELFEKQILKFKTRFEKIPTKR
jgi:peptidoglycan/LPS O-acetylase OafA/YrhL